MSFHQSFHALLVLVVVLLASASWADPVAQKFKLSGVQCYEGSRSVQVALSGVDGIDQVRVMVHAKELQVSYDPERTSAEAIIDAVRHARPSGQSAAVRHPDRRRPEVPRPSS
jgi:copper chaperone CopZ